MLVTFYVLSKNHVTLPAITKRLSHIFLGVLILIFSQQKLFATHGAGLDINYECVSQGTNADNYKITVKYYRDCSSSTGDSARSRSGRHVLSQDQENQG